MPDTDTPTGLRAQKRPLSIAPETQVVVRLGLLATAAVALVAGAIYVYDIKKNGEDALKAIQALRADYAELAKEHKELWWHYQLRRSTTALPPVGSAGP